MENSKVRIATLLIAVVLLFSSCNYLIVNMLFDLDADYVLTGNLDLSFDPGSGANGNISSIAFQDSKIIIAGNFTEYNGTAINRIARLNQDGSLDTSFSPGTG